MGAVDSLLGSIRRIIMMEAKLLDLADGLKDLSRRVVDHEGRLIRIETIIELSRVSAAAPRLSDRQE
jgi:hypothetical protein